MVAHVAPRKAGVSAIARRGYQGPRSGRAVRRDRFPSDRDRAFLRELAREHRRPLTRWKGLVVQMHEQAFRAHARERHNVKQLITIPRLKYVSSLAVDEAAIVAVWLNPHDGRIMQVTEQVFVEVGKDDISLVLEVERQEAGVAIADIQMQDLAEGAPQFLPEWELRVGMVIPITVGLAGNAFSATVPSSSIASAALALGAAVLT